ncbi:cytochrome P450 [Ilyonectria destructans]|nr:cytochrome P450 [Ilyonectria destructans]
MLTILPLPSSGILAHGAILFTVFVILGRQFFGPLRHVPGLWHSRFTGLDYQIAVLTGKGAKYVDALHSQYGPLVRVTPTVASVVGEDAIRKIYGGTRPFAKDQKLADLFSMCRPEHPNMAGIRDHSAAMKRRRVIGPVFSTKFLLDNASIFVDAANEFKKQIENALATNNGTLDILAAYRKTATHVIIQIAFGGCYSSNPDDSVALLDEALHAQFIYSLSRPLFNLMRLFPRWFDFVYGCDRLANVARESIGNYSTNIKKDPQRKDCLGPMLEAKDENLDKSLSLESIVSETMVFLFAGVDSTANTATYVTWELARRPDVQKQVRAEVQAAFQHGFDGVNAKDLQSLRYLNGCIAETLRLHAPFPGLAGRTCPKGGVNFFGYWIPEGVSIGVQQWTTSRDPKTFPDPERFDPHRWDIDEVSFNKKLETMMAFSCENPSSFGSSLCSVTDNSTPYQLDREFVLAKESMAEYEAGLTVPQSGKCVLVIEEKKEP